MEETTQMEEQTTEAPEPTMACYRRSCGCPENWERLPWCAESQNGVMNAETGLSCDDASDADTCAGCRGSWCPVPVEEVETTEEQVETTATATEAPFQCSDISDPCACSGDLGCGWSSSMNMCADSSEGTTNCVECSTLDSCVHGGCAVYGCGMFDDSQTCGCDRGCDEYGNCCSDYEEVCQGPELPGGCPVDMFSSSGLPCTVEDSLLTCEYGEECCCGECHANAMLMCDASALTWSFMYTEACMNPNCDTTSGEETTEAPDDRCNLLADLQYNVIDIRPESIRQAQGYYECAHSLVRSEHTVEEYTAAVLDLVNGDYGAPILIYCATQESADAVQAECLDEGFTNVQSIGAYTSLSEAGCACPQEESTTVPIVCPICDACPDGWLTIVDFDENGCNTCECIAPVTEEPCFAMILCETGCDLVGTDERGCGGECLCPTTEQPTSTEEPCVMVDCLPGCSLVDSDENGCGGTCECGPELPGGCPVEVDMFSSSGLPCTVADSLLTCEYGEECCCGECHANAMLICDASTLTWSFMYTEACMNPNCDTTSEETTEAIEPPTGICVGEIDSMNERCSVLTDQDSCESEGANPFSDGVCDWIEEVDVNTTEPALEPECSLDTMSNQEMIQCMKSRVASLEVEVEDLQNAADAQEEDCQITKDSLLEMMGQCVST